MIQKLRRKFVLVIMLISTILIGTILGVILHFTAANMEVQSISMIRSVTAASFQPGKPGDTVRLPYFTLQVNHRNEISLLDNSYYDLSDKEFVEQIVTAAMRSENEIGEIKGCHLRYCKSSSPMGTILVFADTSSEQAMLRNMFYTCLLIGAVAWAVLWIISISLSRWAVKPVEAAWAQQRQFVADASHELKTPLAVIMSNAELLNSEDADGQEHKNYSGNILQTCYQMRTLVENLLDMARVDSDQVKMQFTELDFSQLAADSALSFQLLYEEQEKTLQCNIADGIRLKGSEQHLYQVMDVLLDNALKYSDPQSEVHVRLIRQGHSCVLSVASAGAPISKENLKNIFKRFYRSDQARTRDGSYGLGLSIAEGIVTAHKGKIWAESINGWNIFHVQLPIL